MITNNALRSLACAALNKQSTVATFDPDGADAWVLHAMRSAYYYGRSEISVELMCHEAGVTADAPSTMVASMVGAELSQRLEYALNRASEALSSMVDSLAQIAERSSRRD